MYEELIKRLRICPDYNDGCVNCKHEHDLGCRTTTMREAANAIEELSKPRWIPVAERLPEPYTWVLVFAEKHEVAFDAFYDGSQWKDAILNGLVVTHWMPLPEPPKEDGTDES